MPIDQIVSKKLINKYFMHGINVHSIVLIRILLAISKIRAQIPDPPPIRYTVGLSITYAGTNDVYSTF